MKFDAETSRKRVIGALSWALPAIWCLLFLVIQMPIAMVLLGGVATSILLLIVVWAAVVFRYRELPHSLIPSRTYDFLFWLSVVSILTVCMYGVWQVLQ